MSKTQQEGEEDFKEEDVDDDDVFEKMSIIIPDITSILALFSNYYECEKLDVCFDNSIKNIDKLKNLCECHETQEKSIIANKIKTLYTGDVDNPFCDKTKLINLLKIIKGYIMKKENLKIKNKLELSFLHIKDSFKGDEAIITRQDMNPEKIIKLIENYLPIRKQEKDKYGEVFTPPQLINEMFDKLPKSVWKDHKLKWLDPANGIGNFPMLAYERLMHGLKSVIPDKIKRSNHIIKNMLYMVELNEKNVAISRKIFGKDANIFCGSFLTQDNKSVNPKVLEEFGIDKFDIIIGNPPFQKERDNTTGTTAGRTTLWDNFISQSFKILNKGGILGFINPPNWRGLGTAHYIWDLISHKQLLYIRIYGEKDGNKIFGVSSRFDLYIVQNKKNIKPTEIIDELGKKHLIKVNEWPFLPNYDYNNIKKILTTEVNGINVIFSSSIYDTRKLKKGKTGKFKHPIVHSITQNPLNIEWYTDDDTKGHFGIPKVILNFNRHQYSHPEQNDYTGKYGMSQISFGIPIKSKREGDEILKAIQTDTFKEIIKATKWGAFQTDYRMFKYFKPDFYKILLKMQKVKTPTPKVKTPTPKVKTPTPKVKTKTKRCPRGTYKNKKTGKCEKKKIKLISTTAKGKYRTFKKRKSKKNKSRRL